MSLANPLGLLLLVSLPIIVLLHLFRQERRRREVSSLYLWREITDEHSRRMRPRLLRNINLLLQLLAALCAALALAHPVLDTRTASGAPELIVMIDDSASMQSSSGGVSRMELARNYAREAIGRAPRNARIMLASAGPRPAIVHAFTEDRARLYELVRTLQATDGANNLPDALDLVRGLGVGERVDIVLITDGAVSLPRGVELPANLEIANIVDRVGVDETAANRAITGFELRARPDGAAFEVLATVANYDEAPASVEFRLSADNEALSTRTLELDSEEERTITAVVPRDRGTLFLAELLGNEDALSVDDRAYAAAAGERPVRVQLVTAGNLFLESFLSIYPNVQLAVTESVDQSQDFDVLILDRVPAPARLRGNVIAFGTALPDGPFTAEESAAVERTITSRAGHPIVRNVRLEGARIGEAVTGTLDPRASVLASAGEMPLLYSYRTETLSLVASTFALTSSDLALRGDFPVLMHNILEWLAPIAPTGEVGYAEVGSIVSLYVPPGEEIVIIDPDGTSRRYTPQTSPFEFARTTRVGFYEARGESFQSRFAVSLANSGESDVRPRLANLATETATTQPVDAPGRALWRAFALAALLLLVADWVVWARRH
ncbi:MAG: vWA domain-containing protein [Spirochaetota bacterium]